MQRIMSIFPLALILAITACSYAQDATVRIMPLGDSITGSPGCWRALLWRKLQDANITNTKFVGTLPAQGCGFPYDGANEGHGGILATGIVGSNQLPGWLSQTHPDVILMHLGTNDVWSNISPENILDAFGTLLQQMRESKNTMKVLVAEIIPMNPMNCGQCGDRIVALNTAIRDWATLKSTPESPVTAVDLWTGFNDATDAVDGVHPNDSGNQKIANAWFEPLAYAL